MSRHATRQPESVRLVIARNLRAAQAESELNTPELAEKVGLGLRLVQKHRAGDHAPSLDNLARYAQVLHKPVAYFFEDAA